MRKNARDSNEKRMLKDHFNEKKVCQQKKPITRPV
jgi:hypothetical protein